MSAADEGDVSSGVSGVEAEAVAVTGAVRLSKAMKRAQRSAAKQQYRREARKLKRQHKTEKLRDHWQGMTEDEREAAKLANKERIRQTEDRLLKGLESGLNICVDLNFEQEHTEKEKRSLCKQVQLCYGVLRRSTVPVHLHLTSLGSLTEQMAGALEMQGISNWKIDRHAGAPWSIFPRENVIYLSPDANETIDRFDDTKVYVIGGIVDCAVRKAVTLNLARDENVVVRRLPIQEYMPGRESHILNIDAVLAIICKQFETGDWTQTLTSTVPLRKQIKGGKVQRKENSKAASKSTDDGL